MEVAYYLGDPVKPEINTGTADSINTIVANLPGCCSAYKFQSFNSAQVISNSKDKYVFSADCSESDCINLATNKIIIANRDSK